MLLILQPLSVLYPPTRIKERYIHNILKSQNGFAHAIHIALKSFLMRTTLDFLFLPPSIFFSYNAISKLDLHHLNAILGFFFISIILYPGDNHLLFNTISHFAQPFSPSDIRLSIINVWIFPPWSRMKTSMLFSKLWIASLKFHHWHKPKEVRTILSVLLDLKRNIPHLAFESSKNLRSTGPTYRLYL